MRYFATLLAALLMFAATGVNAQSERTYTEGSVMQVTSVRVHDGQWDNYLAYLKADYKPVMEEQKKAGIILNYWVHSAQARTSSDPNLYLVTEYPNMASFDGLMDKTEPLAQKVTGQDRAAGQKASAGRATMREILGSERIRELKLK